VFGARRDDFDACLHCTLDPTAPSDVPSDTTQSLFVTHTSQTRPSSVDHEASLTLNASSLVHAPPATIAEAIKLNLASLLDTNPGAGVSEQVDFAYFSRLTMTRALRTGVRVPVRVPVLVQL